MGLPGRENESESARADPALRLNDSVQEAAFSVEKPCFMPPDVELELIPLSQSQVILPGLFDAESR